MLKAPDEEINPVRRFVDESADPPNDNDIPEPRLRLIEMPRTFA